MESREMNTQLSLNIGCQIHSIFCKDDFDGYFGIAAVKHPCSRKVKLFRKGLRGIYCVYTGKQSVVLACARIVHQLGRGVHKGVFSDIDLVDVGLGRAVERVGI